MHNRWTISPERQLGWKARLPRNQATDLTWWQRQALRDGEELAVYHVLAVPDIGFTAADHGPLGEFLDANPALDDGILLFEHWHTASARLAVVDAAGAVVHDDVTDLGDMLAAAPFAAPVRHEPPLALWASVAAPHDTTVPVSISTCSDIWLPWSSARYEEEAETEDFADNTELARRHTPRLNTFLTRLRERTLHLGGTWELDPSTNRDLLFEVDDHGVLLDAPQPLDRISDLEVEGPSRGDVLDTLHGALRLLSHDPPPPPYHAVIRAIVRYPDNELYAADRAQVHHALRNPPDPTTRLTPESLHDVSKVEVDNATGRHTFTVNDITTTRTNAEP